MKRRLATGMLLGSCAALGLVACGSSKKSQTITFSSVAPASTTAGVTPYKATAVSSAGLAVKVLAKGACSDGVQASGFEASVRVVSGSLPSPATIVSDSVGTCTITASQAGNATYEPASAKQTFKVKPNSPTVNDTTRQHTAAAAALALFDKLHLPPGAEEMSSNPSSLLHQPSEEQSYRAALHRFWQVPREPTAILAWLEAHPPAGASKPQVARRFHGTTPTEWFIEFSLNKTPSRPAYIAGERLEIALAGARAGGTGMRVDAQVNWVGSEGQHAITDY